MKQITLESLEASYDHCYSVEVGINQEIEALKQERDLVKNKIEILLENLSEITEGPIG